MKFDIPAEVLATTLECPHSFSCLTTGKCGDKELCSIQNYVADEISILQTKSRADCPYRKVLGTMQICRCPTRNAIVRKYGV
jgi:hypothetical protein